MEETETEKGTIRILKCLRCGHKWPTRNEKNPKVCPSCKNPNWNIPRKVK